MKQWACKNGFLYNGEDPCPPRKIEKKVFGIRQKDIPREDMIRHVFPNKFRK